MTDDQEIIGYVPSCPDCGAVGTPESEDTAEMLVDMHNREKGHSATVDPVTEEDERIRAEAMADD